MKRFLCCFGVVIILAGCDFQADLQLSFAKCALIFTHFVLFCCVFHDFPSRNKLDEVMRPKLNTALSLYTTLHTPVAD